MNLLLRAQEVSSWITTAPRAASSLGLIRLTIGLVGLAFYLSHYAKRELFFGPEGVYGFDLLRAQLTSSGGFSLYAVSDGLTYFEVLFHAGLILALCVFLGVGGRVVLALHAVFLWSIYMTNPAFMDGGDAVVIAGSLFLLLTRCFDRFTVSRRKSVRDKSMTPVRCSIHNTGVLLLASQLSIIYLMAGLYKVQGKMWQDGTALYYILRVPEFFWPGITPVLFEHPWLLVLGAYGTVLVSVFFPVLVWFRGGRPVAVVAMLGFHVAIGALMGLTSFALMMMAADCLFVSGHVEKVRLAITATSRSVLTEVVRILPRRRQSHA